MRIINCLQQSEEWDRWRNRPTASEFKKFVTPAKGEYSSQATAYASKIVAKLRGECEEMPPNWAMERGMDLEPSARHAYALQTGREVEEVGFIIPDGTDAYGASPDGLIRGDDGQYEGGLEIKCPAAETLILWHAEGVLPLDHKTQVQGHLFISGLKWWDFYGFHPGLKPFLVRAVPDLEYHSKIAECLLKLLQEIKRIGALVPKMRHELVNQAAQQDNMRIDKDE